MLRPEVRARTRRDRRAARRVLNREQGVDRAGRPAWWRPPVRGMSGMTVSSVDQQRGRTASTELMDSTGGRESGVPATGRETSSGGTRGVSAPGPPDVVRA